jgi:hypothetical protein
MLHRGATIGCIPVAENAANSRYVNRDQLAMGRRFL